VTVDDKAVSRTVSLIESLVQENEVVGSVLYAEQGEKALVSRAFGWSDREQGLAMQPDTIFRMRSMTKPLVGTAVLMLMEQGHLRLDDKVAQYIPAFDNPAKRDITVFQLLTHTSGVTGSIYDTLGGTQFHTLREAVDYIGKEGPMAFAPGTSYLYSDPGTSALGALVAELSGAPAEVFIDQRIIQPLDMHDSFLNLVPEGDPRRHRVAATYHGSPGSWVKYWDNTQPQLLPFFRASGGMYSTAKDYARFTRAIMQGGSYEGTILLAPETVALALQRHTARVARPDEAAQADQFYGLHWTIYTDKYAPVLPGAFGHGGSDGTIALADPQRDLIVLFLTQSRGTETRRRVLQELLAKPARRSGIRG
jgi:CubicO group peptidase (beta-lactamase class C family)